MKVLKVVQSYYPFLDKGGPAVKVRAIALGLAKIGISVTVLTNDWGFDPSVVSCATITKNSLGWCMEEQGVRCLFLPKVLRYRSLTFNPGVFSFCRAALGEYHVAHIYGLYDLLGPTAAFFCRRNRIPYVVEPMGMFRPIVRSIVPKKAYHLTIGKRFLSGAYRFVATSAQEQGELAAGGISEQRIVVRRNGVDAPQSLPARGAFREKWQIPQKAKLVLYMGRLEPKKSPDLLLNAFAKWRKNSPVGADAVLAICGPEQNRGYQAQLKALACSLDIDAFVRFTGPLYDEKKWEAYRDADVFVLPSQNENFGNSAAEAIACGTPVIVTDQCGIAPFVQGRTGLVVPHDIHRIVAALRGTLEDEEAARRFRNACPTVLKELSWGEPVAQMNHLYAEAVAQARESA